MSPVHVSPKGRPLSGSPISGKSITNRDYDSELRYILEDIELLFNDVHALWEYEDEPGTLALWAVSAWFIGKYGFKAKIRTVYPYVYSYEPDCGKTELALALAMVTPGSIVCTPTVAAIKRFLNDSNAGTLIIDQFHNLGKGKATDTQDLDQVLSNGHAPGIGALLADKDGKGNEQRSLFFPKAFFGLAGHKHYRPSAEVATRLLPFKLAQGTDKEQTELEQRRNDRPVDDHGKSIAYNIGQWVDKSTAKQVDNYMLRVTARTLSDGTHLVNRESDNFRILFALADIAGGKYPALIREAAGRMTTGAVEVEPETSEAERLDSRLLGLMRNGILPVDNWAKPGYSPVWSMTDSANVSNLDLGFISPKTRKRSNKDMLPMVTLVVNELERKAELRIPARDLTEITNALERSRSDFLKAYVNAKRTTGKSVPTVFHKGDKHEPKLYKFDFTPVIFGDVIASSLRIVKDEP